MKNFKQRDVTEILASSQEPDIDGVIIIDEQGIIKSFDNAAQNLFGYLLEEVINKPLVMLMSKAQGSTHPSYIHNANLKDKKNKQKQLHIEQSIIGLHKSGYSIPLAITVSSDSSGSGIRYTGVIQDLRKHEDRLTVIFQDFQANTEALKQRIEFESLLSTQGNKLLSAENHNFASVMEEALQAVCEFLKFDHGYIVKLNADTTEACLWAEWRRSVSLMKAFEKTFSIPARDIISAVFKEKGCIVLEDINKDEYSEMFALAQQLSPNGFISTRIAAIYDDNQEIVGCIGFSILDADHKPNEEQLSLINLATQLLVNAWDRHQLILEARQAEENIRSKNLLLETRANLARILLLSADTLYLVDNNKFQANVSDVLKRASLASNHQQELIYSEHSAASHRELFINQFLSDQLLNSAESPLFIDYINNQLKSKQIFQLANLNDCFFNDDLKNEFAKLNIASFTAVKMNSGDQYLGFICFYNNHPFYQSAEVALNFLQLTVQNISSAIEHHSTHYNLLLSEQKLFTANQLLTQQALQDALTSLPNRRAFDTNFNLEFDRAKRHKSSLTLLMCDIDSFKLYNDHFGHPQGDECLKQVAEVLQRTFNRAGELSTRYGGEEFAIILPSVTRAEAEQQAQRLINNLEKRQIPHAPGLPRPYVTISVGIAQYSAKQDFINHHALLEAADQALYQAKMNGRNQLAWATEEE